jgi:cytoskeletal protein CcmA (bactofilin family)
MAFNRNGGFGDRNLLGPSGPRFGAAPGDTSSDSEDAAALDPVPAPIFQERPGAATAEKCANVIARDARWKGSLTIPDSVRIDGQFNGDIDAKGTVFISDGATVEAKIKATYVVIGGNFRGEVRCSERTELLARAKVLGDVITKLFTIHEGAVIDGSIHMSGDKLSEPSKPANGSRSRAEAAGVTAE